MARLRIGTACGAAPGDVVLTDGEASYTAAELAGRASQVAGFLAGQTLGPGGLVGIYMPRSIEWVAALLKTPETRSLRGCGRDLRRRRVPGARLPQ